MPSAGEIFEELQHANGHLLDIAGKVDLLKGSMDAVLGSVEQVKNILTTNLGQLIALTVYATQALYQNDLQNGTVICILKKIAKHTCDLVNQAHRQTALQKAIDRNTAAMGGIFALAHAAAALALERERALRKEIAKCCPPAPPVAPCYDKPCPAPPPIGPPPDVVVIE